MNKLLARALFLLLPALAFAGATIGTGGLLSLPSAQATLAQMQQGTSQVTVVTPAAAKSVAPLLGVSLQLTGPTPGTLDTIQPLRPTDSPTFNVPTITGANVGATGLVFDGDGTSISKGVDGNLPLVINSPDGSVLVTFGADGSSLYTDTADATLGNSAHPWASLFIIGGTVTLTGGNGTITSSAIFASSVVMLSLKTVNGANAYPQIAVRDGSATVTGLVTDAGTYNWRVLR